MKRLLGAALAASLCSSSALAAITINITQSGSSVVVTGSGSFNTSGLPSGTESSFDAGINPRGALVRVGSPGDFFYYLNAATGPDAFGPVNNYIDASASSGDLFGVAGASDLRAIYLPRNYQSGAPLAGQATFLNATLASLGLTAGTYLYQGPADTITVNIGAAAETVPEPASWAMFIGGFGLLGAAMRRRNTAAAFG